MKFNPNPLEFLKNRGEQSALKSIIKTTTVEFERDLLSVGRSDFQGLAQLRYDNLKVNKFLELRSAVSSLRGNAKKILERFSLSPDVGDTLKEIDKICGFCFSLVFLCYLILCTNFLASPLFHGES